MTEGPEKIFLTETRPVTGGERTESGHSGVLQSLSRDLLQQALHEVQEVKEEPGIYNRMEQILVNQEVSLGDISHLHRSDTATAQDSLDKVKVEPLAANLLSGGAAVDSMILIPTLQSDGSLAYAVQPGIPVQPGQALINTTTSVISSSNSSPNKLQHKVALLRNNVNKPKNILPKTFQPQPCPAKLCKPPQPPVTPSTMSQILAPLQPQGFTRVTPSETVNRKVQLRRTDGQTKTVELSYTGAEVNIRCEQPLNQLELQHVQSIMRQSSQPSQQVYRVVNPARQTSVDIVNLEEEPDKEQEQDKEHFSVAAFVREFSKNRGRGKKHSRGRPRKGTSKINEKKVISELRREFGIRNGVS